MKRAAIVLCMAVSLPFFSMGMNNVSLLKKSNFEKPKLLIAYHQSEESIVQRREELKKYRNEGTGNQDVLGAFLMNNSQIVCIKSDALIISQVQEQRKNKNQNLSALYASLATSRSTYQVLNSKTVPRVGFSLAGGHSFLGPDGSDSAYADIPFAIEKFASRYLLKKILIIDENCEKNMRARVDYYLHGNGAFFYNDEESSISPSFNDINIVVANQIACLLEQDEQSDVVSRELLEKYLVAEENVQQKFDLAYYVVRLENVEKKITGADSSDQLCNDRICSLLDNHIPTVVVFSGDIEQYPSIAVQYMRNVFDYALQVYKRYKK